MTDKLRIAIGIPTTGNIRIETAVSIMAIVDETKRAYPGIEILFIYIIGSYIHENRTIIALNAQKEKATHLLFVDTDMIPPINGLIRLLERDKMIIAADYNKRAVTSESIAVYDKKNYNEHEPFEAQYLPTGFMLINMKVFDKLKRPWFFFKDGSKDSDMMGEDFFMVEKARNAGFKVYVEPTLKVWHIGTAVY